LKGAEQISPKAAEEAAFRIAGGGHFSSADRLHMRRGAEQFEGTTLAPVANALGKFWRAPGPKQASELWNHWTDFMFKTVNGRFESAVQTAMLGRALKDAGLKAQEDAAKGLTNTANQVRFGREVDRMFGRYGKLRPQERIAIATFTPFVMWSLNAAYFVFRTLPRDHPVATTVTAASVNATDEWRKNHGLDLFMKGALPGFLQGSVPTRAAGISGSRSTRRSVRSRTRRTPPHPRSSLLRPVFSRRSRARTGRARSSWSRTGRNHEAGGSDRADRVRSEVVP
jgi:hypothetical protein